jgi:hypothetical protein
VAQLEDALRLPAQVGSRLPSAAMERDKQTRPVLWWAAIGAAFLALQIYIYLAWIISGDAHRTPTGPDPVSSSTKFWAWSLQAASVLGMVVVIVYCVRRSRREKRLTFDALVAIGFFSVFWQDTIVNYIRPNFFYNSYLVNFGAWDPHIPGWLSQNAQKTPEPILLSGPIYVWWFVLFAVVFCGVAKRAKQRWPGIGKVGLFFIGAFVLGLLDFALESLAMHGNLWAYSSVIRPLTIFDGHRFQFPLYEPFLIVGPTCSVIGLLRYRRNDLGQSAPERGLDRVRASSRQKSLLAALAFVGLANVVFGAFNVVWNWGALYGGQTPSYPSYFRNGICGPGTAYSCPGPRVPIPLPQSRPT